MGLFSWKTSDTQKSIACLESNRNTFTVFLLSPDGRKWQEDNYEGYGEFGGKDIYSLISEINGGDETREDGLDKTFHNNICGDFGGNNFIYPILVEDGNLGYEEALNTFGHSEVCEYQGFFYDDDDYHDDFDDLIGY